MTIMAMAGRSERRPGLGGVMESRRVCRNREAPRVSVVVPTRNEAANLPLVFSRMPLDVHEVLVVDGRSTDGTIEVARTLRPDVQIIEQTGKGKGDALALGFLHATGDIIVTLDADGSADAAEIPRFVAALVAGADFAKGSRFMHGGGSADITPLRSLGNKVFCAVVNSFYGAHFTDLCYGYNDFWAECLDNLSSPWPWFGDEGEPEFGTGFEVETVINVRSVKGGLVVWEVPSYECRRLHGESNLHVISDGMRIVRTLVRESPARAARRAVPCGSPTGTQGGILPVTSFLQVPAPSSAPWVVIPEQRRTEFAPVLAIAPEELEILESAAGVDHAR